MLAISCIAVPLAGCGPIHWLMLPGACRQCGVQGCTLHSSPAQGQGKGQAGGDVVNPPRPRFHPVPTRPVFTAGYTPASSPRGIPNAAQPTEQNDGPVDGNRRRQRSIEPNPLENGDTDASDTDSSDTDAASEDIPENTARNRTAQRQPLREIASPKVEQPVPAVKPMRYSQPQAKDENGLLWRRRNVGN